MSAVQIKNPLTIVKSGSEPTPVTPKDPYEVYTEERSAEWWPMPANEDVNDNEIYLLYHIAKPNDTPYEGESWALRFLGTGPTVTIEYGAMVDGEFVPDATKTETINVNVSTYSNYTFNMKYADFPANDLTNGDRQVMIKISSGGDITNMQAVAPSALTAQTTNWNSAKGLVEFKGRATQITSLKFSFTISGGRASTRKLTFFSLLGTNKLQIPGELFTDALSLRAVLELDTSSMLDMSSAFDGCHSLRAIPLFNTSSAVKMYRMFAGCWSLQTIPLLDTSSVTSFEQMFTGCRSLQTIPLLDTSSATTTANMFESCYALQSIPLLDTSSVTLMLNMFSNCYTIKEIPSLVTSSVIKMDNMFAGCYALQSIPLLDTSSVTNMSGMFSSCTSLQTIPQIVTSSVTNMANMFNNCNSLQTIPLLDTSSVTNTVQMFYNCNTLRSIPLLDTSSVTTMSNMFYQCFALQTVPQFNTSSATDMLNMFQNCYSLQTIPLLDTSSATTVQNTFSGVSSLQFADFSNYDLTSVTRTSYQNFVVSNADGSVVKIDPTKNIPVAGITLRFVSLSGRQSNPSFILIEDENTMFPILANATTVFGTNQYAYVVVPDSMYETYAADQYWATLTTRLKKRSEVTLPSWYTGV